MTRLLSFLSFLRLVDKDDGSLSLSSIALAVTLAGAVWSPGLYSLLAFAVAGTVYGHRRVVRDRTRASMDATAVLSARLESLAASLHETRATVLTPGTGLKDRLVTVENRTRNAGGR